MIAALSQLTLAALKWDPTIRGLLFPGIMIVILAGSSYVIMATNMGNRLGFLVAITALTGWMFLMSIAWLLYGIGLKGNPNHWKVQEVITGTDLLKVAQYRPAEKLAGVPFDDAAFCVNADAIKGKDDADTAKLVKAANAKAKTVREAAAAKTGWKPVCEGTPERGDAQATLDATIVRAADPSTTPRAIFAKTSEYRTLGAWERGGDNQLFTIKRHKFYLTHSPHWFAIPVQPVKTEVVKLPVKTVGGVQAKDPATGELMFTEKTQVVKDASGVPLVDTSKPPTTVLFIRDLGTKRQPPFVLFIFSGMALAILVSVLHQRDKQVMSAMGGKTPAKA